MKIFAQDRQSIMDMPKEVWATEITGGRGFIVCSNRVHPYLGTYETVERADEVLAEMFDYFRNGKNSYVMPEE